MANPIDIYGYIMIHYIISYTYNEHYHVLMHTYVIYVAKKHFIFSWGINKQLKKGEQRNTHIYIYIYILHIYIYIYSTYIYINTVHIYIYTVHIYIYTEYIYIYTIYVIYYPFILSIKVSTDLISLFVRAAVRESLQHS